MSVPRRMTALFIAIPAMAVIAWLVPAQCNDPSKEVKKMHGMIGKMTAVEGKRDELIAILLEGIKAMPGCLSYVIARDPADANAVWISEVWEDQASHKASLALPAVKDAITKGKPMIAKFDQSTITEPVGGHGLPVAKGR